jgi:hypothetical protein
MATEPYDIRINVLDRCFHLRLNGRQTYIYTHTHTHTCTRTHTHLTASSVLDLKQRKGINLHWSWASMYLYSIVKLRETAYLDVLSESHICLTLYDLDSWTEFRKI